ncbi:MAG TPA: rhomboid family intramembrane serine protease [Clostridiales bacterium]|nr:rhomboid family intramembrane serine protease [Clostridiales bacterium]
MIEERLLHYFINNNFRRIGSNIEDIYFYYMINDNREAYIISVFNMPKGVEYSTAQYEYIIKQIKDSFINNGTSTLHLLSLIVTGVPEIAKSLCLESIDNHWIIDANRNKLIIYETQEADFIGLRKVIDNILCEENDISPLEVDSRFDYESNIGNQGTNPLKRDKRNLGQQFGIINSMLIITNLIAFIILHYSNFLGGTEEMMGKGALSWIYVIELKEYHRIFTSMFMHDGWRHLINNMLVLLFIGDNLEREIGKIRYLIIYILCGVIAGIASISYNMIKLQNVHSIGASGAVLGVVGAMIAILIMNKGKLENLSGQRLVLFAAFSLYGGVSNAGIDQAAHVGGFIAGLILAFIIYRKPRGKRRGKSI